MAALTYPTALAPLPETIQGRGRTLYAETLLAPATVAAVRDYRQFGATGATISDVMVLKTAAGEQPFAMGRVWALRAADGYKAWEGWTDAAGAYTATGLEAGVDYVFVGIDPTRQHKTTGAGPVVAA